MGRTRTGEDQLRVDLWIEPDDEVRELPPHEAAKVPGRYPALLHQHRKYAAMSGRPGGRLVVIDQPLVSEIVKWLDRPRRERR